MHWPIHIWTKVVCDTIHACANAVSQRHRACDNIQMTLNRRLHNHSMMYGNGNSHLFNKLKVRQIGNSIKLTIFLSYPAFSILPTEEMHKFIAEQLQTGRVPLCINPQSAAFKSFAR